MNQKKYYDYHGDLIQGGDFLIRVEYVNETTKDALIKIVEDDGEYVSDLNSFYRSTPIEKFPLKGYAIYRSIADIPINVNVLTRESDRTSREIAQLEREMDEMGQKIYALGLYRREISSQIEKINTIQQKIDIKALKASRRHRTGVNRIK